MSDKQVIIVGAGLAGLACARELNQRGTRAILLEAGDGVGGRVRTDRVNGFLLDRGFQVLLTAYPEAQRVLNYRRLNLHPFRPGALVRFRSRFHTVSDPLRRPADTLPTVMAPVGSLLDKLNVARLRLRLESKSVSAIFHSEDTSTLLYLRRAGFSEKMIDRFFRPFLGGIFLDRNLATSSRMFEFVFKMLSEGDTVIPSGGMGSIPEQMASDLPLSQIRLNSRVVSVEDNKVRLAGGEEIQGDAIIIAVEGPAAASLLEDRVTPPQSLPVSALYFAAERAPISAPILILNGDGAGPINNLTFPSQVAPSYAPANQTLVCASVLGDSGEDSAQLQSAVRSQMQEWFGPIATTWRHLATYHIEHAQPAQPPGSPLPSSQSVQIREGLFVCGDYRENASINGALVSGQRAADAVLTSLAV